jgi:hypothetical protein
MYQCGSCRATFPYKQQRCPKCGISFIGEERLDKLKPSFEAEARQKQEQAQVRRFFGWALLSLVLAGAGWLAYQSIRLEVGQGGLRDAALQGDLAEVKRYLGYHWGPVRVDINKSGLTCKTPGECYRMTPLMAAARFGHGPVVAFLLDHGADPSIKSSDGFTAADLARKFGHPKVAELLQSRVRH